MTVTPEPLSAVHKLLRTAMASVAVRLGRTERPLPPLLAEVDALLAAIAWRNAWVAQQLLPLLETQEPGAGAPAQREQARLDRPLAALRNAVQALPLQPDVERAAAWQRLYRRWTLLQSHALALLHHDETTWLPSLWHRLQPAAQAALWTRLRQALPAVLCQAGRDALTPAEWNRLLDEDGGLHA